ncbi:MAG: type II secretion system protein [Nostocaceae cyanobacterium]|nr:type II secretion system protein [Nostocaceae cyanobacterium]
MSTKLNIQNIAKYNSSNGFTLLEVLVVTFAIGILGAIATPSWLAFIHTRNLNAAQNEVYQAMRQAQSQAKLQKLTWQASFQEQNGILQWAVHPATVSPKDAIWNDLDPSVKFDAETTLQESDGVRQIEFDYMGTVKILRRITLSSKNGGKAKRCVFISTLLGTIRTAKENDTAQDGKYCY